MSWIFTLVHQPSKQAYKLIQIICWARPRSSSEATISWTTGWTSRTGSPPSCLCSTPSHTRCAKLPSPLIPNGVARAAWAAMWVWAISTACLWCRIKKSISKDTLLLLHPLCSTSLLPKLFLSLSPWLHRHFLLLLLCLNSWPRLPLRLLI